ncbi:hypothetical protein RM190_13045 [Paracoccus sp. CPCC 101403]|jgi:hypothetical protein|uniref:Uncharacterized protein n=2 Tax=Paracoccus broussonetiae TaxID=3075834 RepID=A0ABU3EEY2_9RHOB|nr:hypothetical protein [Paracoccus sp. CPCC 101403]MDT1062798.1 hypothetical protein [Paracoccus sp. CPCC 101403]
MKFPVTFVAILAALLALPALAENDPAGAARPGPEELTRQGYVNISQTYWWNERAGACTLLPADEAMPAVAARPVVCGMILHQAAAELPSCRMPAAEAAGTGTRCLASMTGR